jgi:hypothetical protein
MILIHGAPNIQVVLAAAQIAVSSPLGNAELR